MAITDSTPFEYDHGRPRAYEYKTTRNLKRLQVAMVEYAQSHKGYLPPMQNSEAADAALRPYLGWAAKFRSQNPATETPFTPNAALSHQKINRVSNHGRTILFYDANPPAGFRESYYITIKGEVGHVPVAEIPKLL